MSRVNQAIAALSSMLFALPVSMPAWAADEMPTPSFPTEWQLGLQNAASPVMERMTSFHNLLLVIITAISLFVLALLMICAVRYNERVNPVPAKWSHNTMIEVVWTALPVLILALIAVPSYRLLYFQDRTEQADMTLKIVGNQWYWSYEYPDTEITFDAIATPDKDIKPGQHRLLETDNHVVLPVETNVRLLMTATDVIHAWAIPAFGVKLDNVPGRTNETWVRPTKLGRFYGQCSELCGVDHSFMPIVVDVVSKEAYTAWVASKKAPAAPAEAPAAPPAH
ncbi:MAG: cytochrome c oxidase subunit II [Rhodospirillaceae bacterium]|nr:cytochrome c oxidase subunit II [Rhodospirillaceae bacterium]